MSSKDFVPDRKLIVVHVIRRQLDIQSCPFVSEVP